MPFAVCRFQRASGVFCSLSYTDASFLYSFTLFVVSFWPFPLISFPGCVLLGAEPHLNCDIALLCPYHTPPSCNINHSDIRCMFTWIWSTKMLYGHVALPTGNQWQMQSRVHLCRKWGETNLRVWVWAKRRGASFDQTCTAEIILFIRLFLSCFLIMQP